MPKTIVNPPSLPKPSGFSHGIVASGGRILFLAGQTGSGGDGNIAAPGDLVAQFEQAILNLKAVCEAAGGKLADVVKLNIFVRDRNRYLELRKPLGQVFRRHFGGHYPTMALFEVSGLFQEEALVELEGMAALDF